MRHLDLFSGIGGFALAAKWCWGDDHKVEAFCEIDPYAQQVLKEHWPDTPIETDIRGLDGTVYSGIDLLTGGFPCQPFSNAGLQRGKEDDRDLWPEMLRVIKESRPTWVIGENVAGFVKMELDRSISDLESIGYACQPIVIPACAVGAPHRRDRVWIIANAGSSGWKEQHDSKKSGWQGLGSRVDRIDEIPTNASIVGWNGGKTERSGEHGEPERKTGGRNCAFTHSNRNGQQEAGQRFSTPGLHGTFGDFRRSPEPTVHRMDDGISKRLDRHRIKALGNAIVPQVAFEIMQAIKDVSCI